MSAVFPHETVPIRPQGSGVGGEAKPYAVGSEVMRRKPSPAGASLETSAMSFPVPPPSLRDRRRKIRRERAPRCRSRQPTADSRLDLSARSHRRTRCGRANASRPATWRTSSHHGSSACVRSLMRQQLWQSKRKLRWICITLLLNKAYMPQGRFDRRRYAAILKS